MTETERPTAWTDTPPNENGFYWARKRDQSVQEVVEVLGCPETPYVLRAGKDADEAVESFLWWPDRLPEPER